MRALATTFRMLASFCGERSTWSVTELAAAPIGSIHAVVAVGLSLAFGVLRIINFAHGEYLLLDTPGGAAIFKQEVSYV
jgi:hypothetical protein